MTDAAATMPPPAPVSVGCPNCGEGGLTVQRRRPGKRRALRVCMACARRANLVWLDPETGGECRRGPAS